MSIRTYQVGFGDCFLLSFRYADSGARHVLIDFGSTAMPDGISPGRQLRTVAEDIRRRTGGKLHAVVATHRHKDHIGGFARGAEGRGTGAVIRDLRPDVIVQPWTEHPDLDPEATDLRRPQPAGRRHAVAHVASLAAMQDFAHDLGAELKRLRGSLSRAVAAQLSFVGDDNVGNRDAVENLMTMGRRRSYVYFGARSGLESVLPGVRIHVLGPPTLRQSARIRSQREEDNAEFWHLQAKTHELRDGRGDARPLFARAPRHARGREPAEARWLINHARTLRGEQLLGLVRILDNAINNTSLILLFEIGGTKLLFSGDAQIENWSYALSRERVRRLLRGTSVYKVGHHGSLNATPKSLFQLFVRRRSRRLHGPPLIALLSTMAGKHGNRERETEVPRGKLVEALAKETDLRTTQGLGAKLYLDVALDL